VTAVVSSEEERGKGGDFNEREEEGRRGGEGRRRDESVVIK
jgi:hypothetical protein